MRSAPVILGIEAAVEGGSLSVFTDGRELGHSQENGRVARAENLLANIEDLLRSENIGLDKLSAIAVSAGPGSFTGIRIGLATAMGLAKGLGIPVFRVSLLHAIGAASNHDGDLVTAVPMGRGMVCVQHFRRNPARLIVLGEPMVVTFEEFERVKASEDVFSPDSMSENPAACLCRAALNETISKDAAPIFVSKPGSV